MEKNLDNKGRWRNKIVAFRVSPEEAEQIDHVSDCQDSANKTISQDD